jgi:hypothetical protein
MATLYVHVDYLWQQQTPFYNKWTLHASGPKLKSTVLYVK